MQNSQHIRVSVGIFIKDKRILLVRAKNSNFYSLPGGKLEVGESSLDALRRELFEELQVSITKNDTSYLGMFRAKPYDKPEGTSLSLFTYHITAWSMPITPSAEIEEVQWTTAADALTLNIAPAIRYKYIPLLRRRGLLIE